MGGGRGGWGKEKGRGSVRRRVDLWFATGELR